MSDEQEAEPVASESAEAGDEDDDAAPDGADEEVEAESGGLQEGDFVRLEYTIRTVEDDTLVDTTDKELAEEEGIDTEEQEFAPRTIVLGAGHVFEAVEADLIGREVGENGSVTIPTVEGFGEYDPDQVRTVSADRLPEDQRHPGAHVNLDNQHGHVETVIGGRARVDFNHPLAGEDLEYEYEIVAVVEDPLERAQDLLGMYLDVDLEMSLASEEEERPVAGDQEDEGEDETELVELETLYIEATPQLAMNQQWLFSKGQIANEIIDRVGIDRIVVREVLDGSGGMGGLGAFGDLDDVDIEEAIEGTDLDDVDTEEVIEELEGEPDLEVEESEE